MTRKIASQKPYQTPADLAIPVEARESAPRAIPVGQQILSNDDFRNEHASAGPLKHAENTSTLQLAEPSQSNNIRGIKVEQKHVSLSARGRSPALPEELIVHILGYAHDNPFDLMTLMEDQNDDKTPSTLSRIASDNRLWAPFAPQRKKNESVRGGYYAQQFMNRYNARVPEARKYLETCWQGTGQEVSGIYHDMMNKAQRRINSIKCNDHDIMRAMISYCGPALQAASEDLTRDPGLVYLAVRKEWRAFQHAHESLRCNEKFVLSVLRLDSRAFSCAHENLRRNKEFVLRVVRLYASEYVHVHYSLKGDREIALVAMRHIVGHQASYILYYAHENLQRDPELRLLAGWPPFVAPTESNLMLSISAAPSVDV